MVKATIKVEMKGEDGLNISAEYEGEIDERQMQSTLNEIDSICAKNAIFGGISF
jgi:hypothetical protein